MSRNQWITVVILGLVACAALVICAPIIVVRTMDALNLSANQSPNGDSPPGPVDSVSTQPQDNPTDAPESAPAVYPNLGPAQGLISTFEYRHSVTDWQMAPGVENGPVNVGRSEDGKIEVRAYSDPLKMAKLELDLSLSGQGAGPIITDFVTEVMPEDQLDSFYEWYKANTDQNEAEQVFGPVLVHFATIQGLNRFVLTVEPVE